MYFKYYLRLKERLAKRAFLSNVLTLMTGTVFAQVLTIAISPILTRLYSPHDYGVFALFLSISSILAVIFAGRYELAIVLPDKHEQGLCIFLLCIGLSFITTSLLSLVVATGSSYISQLVNLPEIQTWLLIIPVAAFLSVQYQILYYWFNRTKQFLVMSRSRMITAFVTAGASAVFGYYHFEVGGLILAYLLGQVCSVTIMASLFIIQEKDSIKRVSFFEVRKQALRYSDFPKFLIISHFISSLSLQLPVILLNNFFGVTVVGYFAMAQRTISMPMSLIAQSIGDVFRQRASEEYRTKGNCPIIYMKTLKALSILGIVPCLFLIIIAPNLFGLIFGEQWTIAGRYVQMLSFMLYFRLISSPLSMMYMIAEKQSKDLLLQIYIICSVTITIYLGWYYGENPELSIFLFSLNYCLIYSVNLYITKKWACAS